MSTYRLYTGAYTTGGGHAGVHALSWEDGALNVLDQDFSLTNPSYVLPANGRLYAVEEQRDAAAIAIFHTDERGLNLLARYPVPGSAMCHICSNGTYLFASNYLAGSLVGIREATGALCCTVQHEGRGVDAVRQEGPHMHSALFSPDGKRVLAADLGLDRLFQYELAPDGSLTPWAAQPWVQAPPGRGPRHFAFHPNGGWLYLVAEMGKTLLVYRHDPAAGVLSQTAEHSLRGGGCPPHALAADIHLTPGGDFLYASVRGSDRIFGFRVSGDGGTLTEIGSFPCGGRGPRSFDLSPDGKYLACANMESGNVAVFSLDPAAGTLSGPLTRLALPQVSCVKWAQP